MNTSMLSSLDMYVENITKTEISKRTWINDGISVQYICILYGASGCVCATFAPSHV